MHIPAAIFALGIVAPIAWMALDRTPPYTRTEGVMVPDDPTPGDFVAIRWKLNVRKVCPPATEKNIYRSIVTASGRNIKFEPIIGYIGGSRKELNRTEITREFQIPNTVEAGSAIYRAEACFACNPIHHFFPVCVTAPEVPFTIREEPDNSVNTKR